MHPCPSVFIRGFIVSLALCWASIASASGASAASWGVPTLSLHHTAGPGPIHIGQTVQIEVRMSGLGGNLAAGFQAFLAFDPATLKFENGAYTSSPFGLAVISPIVETGSSGGEIDLASGINQFAGQQPTASDAALAYITFTAQASMCDLGAAMAVGFRPHDPPTRLTAMDGAEILPLALLDPAPAPPTCPADQSPPGGDNVVDIDDLLLVITQWGPCPLNQACCPGDADPPAMPDAVVDINDLLLVITQWGPCPSESRR